MDSTSKFNSKQVMKFIIIEPNYRHKNYKTIKILSRLIWLSNFSEEDFLFFLSFSFSFGSIVSRVVNNK